MGNNQKLFIGVSLFIFVKIFLDWVVVKNCLKKITVAQVARRLFILGNNQKLFISVSLFVFVNNFLSKIFGHRVVMREFQTIRAAPLSLRT